MAERREIIFRGRVQGVGFRDTVRRTASRFEVAGTVRNEPDGTVRCIAEGEATELDRFLEAVRTAMEANLSAVESRTVGVRGDLDGFRIVR
ncbi:MAG: acylphosphatase [Phycisphaerales bacterium]|nr:acylphosphatase [Phycisphaerales bacterium]